MNRFRLAGFATGTLRVTDKLRSGARAPEIVATPSELRLQPPPFPKRRGCPFPADDGAYAVHLIDPRPVVCTINLRFRRFGCGMGQISGLSAYYIARDPTMLRAAQPTREPTILLKMALTHEPATISPCTITMDHDAIICSMTDRLARGPDQDVHVPSVVGPKYPSRGVDVIYL